MTSAAPAGDTTFISVAYDVTISVVFLFFFNPQKAKAKPLSDISFVVYDPPTSVVVVGPWPKKVSCRLDRLPAYPNSAATVRRGCQHCCPYSRAYRADEYGEWRCKARVGKIFTWMILSLPENAREDDVTTYSNRAITYPKYTNKCVHVIEKKVQDWKESVTFLQYSRWERDLRRP